MERTVFGVQELTLQAKKLYAEDGILSPEEEAALRQRLTVLETKNAALEEENAELKQQLANLTSSGMSHPGMLRE